jgi:hypothetical protein
MSAEHGPSRHHDDALAADTVASAPHVPPTPELTTVNGIGMWSQWTRNFKSPLLALLDLMDNAFDATKQTQQEFAAEIHVCADKGRNETVTGLCLVNNAPRHIKPMAQILEVYQSSKGNQTESIGENGVGLKQGCANLSDLSICLSKNLNQYSIGIISKSLQQERGCVLPSFSFTELPSGLELMELFTTKSIEGEAIKEYGNGFLERGVARIREHFHSFEELRENDHVFCVILHHLKHGPSEQTQQNVNYHQNAIVLMDSLKEALPRRYIHVPSTSYVFVDGDLIDFTYWQRRLVELSEFQLEIDPTRSVWTARDWVNPRSGYTLRVYAGFDPLRLLNVTDRKQKSPLDLYVYSREAGRLITHFEDARGTLGLTNSGSQYCQGLTILVDDLHGKLPLNPTKQDLAFSEEAHGEVHQANLFAWLSAVTRLYYNRHQNKFPENKRRTLLTAEVKRHLPTIESFQNPNHSMKPMAECTFTRFTNIKWTKGSGLIRTVVSKCQLVSGADTLTRILAPAPPLPPPVRVSPLVARVPEPDVGGGSRKRKADESSDIETESEDSSDDEDEPRTPNDAVARSTQHSGGSSVSSSSSLDTSDLRGEHYERRLNNELEASFERERMHRKVIEDLSKSLETRNAENQSLKKALEEAHAEVATVKRELQLQEAFCEDLRSRLAEDRVLTLL